MSYKEFVASLCDAGLGQVISGYKLRKIAGISEPSFRAWIKEGLPHSRTDKGHYQIKAQEAICWLTDSDRVKYAGLIFDHFNDN